ncbi:MAG TPA: flavodoxin family protein [Sedimentisphaerales bacterium]|jgi:multimeric flavodoxin WrbA|nr:flavodoxin family protein [Sedimentisphaerales bacterium]HNU27564.1 flavodoxin family protein [Sedimentisphaerales bacterium]
MKAVVINGSPRGDKGNTGLILNPFLEGMKSAGAEVEVFETKDMNVRPCQGEYACWFRTPGRCFQEDDMQKLLPELLTADVLVLATPLYVDGMTGPLKMVVDRMIPLGEPKIEYRDDHCRHPGRATVQDRKLALVSNCGFWELDNFDALVNHVQAIAKNLDAVFAGALLRPHGPALRAMLDQGIPVADVLDAARDAGRQLVETGSISTETLGTVSRPLLARDQYVAIANQVIAQRVQRTARNATD